jgi:hypothetical protein
LFLCISPKYENDVTTPVNGDTTTVANNTDITPSNTPSNLTPPSSTTPLFKLSDNLLPAMRVPNNVGLLDCKILTAPEGILLEVDGTQASDTDGN